MTQNELRPDVEETIQKMHEKAEEEEQQRKFRERQEKKRAVMSKYIFDDDKVMKIRPFSLVRFDANVAGFGLLLPKEIEIKDKNGNFLGTKQIFSPSIITSEPNLLEVKNNCLPDEKIRFQAIPSELDLRWSLKSIRKFLKNECGKIEGIKLFNKIKRKYLKYLYYQSDVWYSLHALWDIGTYFFMLFSAYPIFELRGLKRTAKTKTMAVSSFMTSNSTGIMVNPSEAMLFRETHDKRPTKYIDEAEKLFTFQKNRQAPIPDSRIEVINSSYYHNGTVPRVEKIGNRFVTHYYHTYSPTMVGSINGLYGATEDRAIIHICVRAPKNDKRGDLEPSEESDEWKEIRNELYIFALQSWDGIEAQYRLLENDTKLRNRDFQIWKPLLTIAKFLNEQLHSEILGHAEKLSKVKDQNEISEGTLDFEIIQIIHELLDTENKTKPRNIFIIEIHERLSENLKAHYKTIRAHIVRFGLEEHCHYTRKNKGYCWTDVTYNIFESIISPIFPSFGTLGTHDDNDNDDISSEVKEEEVKDSEPKGNQVNEGSV